MIKSMTGFGRSSCEKSGRSFIVEIKSVNHRYLDFNIKTPRNLISFEDKIRKVASQKLSRGKIDVYITQFNYEVKDAIPRFNSELGDSYVKCLNEIRERYKLKDDISISLIAKCPDVIVLEHIEEDEDEIWEILLPAIEEALDMLVDMRLKEGEQLQKNILKRCDYIDELIDNIESKSYMLVDEYREKLNNRINELLENDSIDENRIEMEVVMYADKACIDEEIVRLKSHLIQMRETLNLNEPVGRKMDFIVQEMNREINTIASKTSDLYITNNSLTIKSEIEKIREQIQNIE